MMNFSKIIFCLSACFFLSHSALSQTPSEELQKGESAKTEANTTSRPFNSLTIFIGEVKTAHCGDEIEKQPDGYPCWLSSDGTFYHRAGVTIGAESIASVIESAGKRRGDCVLKIYVNRFNAVDFDTVAKAIKSLGGVEKKFKRFRIDAILPCQTTDREEAP